MIARGCPMCPDCVRGLRSRPERSDRELLESAARIQLGREAIPRAGNRLAGVPMEKIEREAVKAVREARRGRAAEREPAVEAGRCRSSKTLFSLRFAVSAFLPLSCLRFCR